VTDRFTFDAAPYVLGALSPEERLGFEAHLATCPMCEAQVREFAGLPGLLSRLPADEVSAALSVQPEPPPTLLPALQFAVRRERRSRRSRTMAAGLVAACLAIVGTGFAVHEFLPGSTGGTPSGPTQALPSTQPLPRPGTEKVTFKSLTSIPVKADADLTPVAWGTQILMRCTYGGTTWQDHESSHDYRLRITDTNNRHYTIGDWNVLLGKEVQVPGSTGVAMSDIRTLEILSDEGTPLLRADM
jgi:Putative zinc-finger